MRTETIILSLSLVVFLPAALRAEKPQAEPQRLDFAKTAVIEAPVKSILASATPITEKRPSNSNTASQDVTKMDIESPAKRIVVANSDQPRDFRKDTIEVPLKELLATVDELNKRETVRPAKAKNPKVAAGKVDWHPDFAAALLASRKSGKPVMLFQLMGNLDDRFC